MTRTLTLIVATCLVMACSTESTAPQAPANPNTGAGVETPHPGGDPVPLDRLGTSNLAPDAPEPEPGLRSRQRMDLDQLDRALEDATGFRWMDGNSDTSMLSKLAGTLGRPDYIQTTLEDLTPSLLFHKFLDDAGRSVCSQLMAAEAERSPEERIFLVSVDPASPMTDEAAVNVTLANALLRFHGRHMASDDPRLDVWRWLLENTPASEEDPLAPWTNVCVGLITHPDFFAY